MTTTTVGGPMRMVCVRGQQTDVAVFQVSQSVIVLLYTYLWCCIGISGVASESIDVKGQHEMQPKG